MVVGVALFKYFAVFVVDFIENVGDATSADVAALIGEARRRVREQFGVELEHEVELLGAIVIP